MNLLRIRNFVSKLELPTDDSLMFMAGMAIGNLFPRIEEAIATSPGSRNSTVIGHNHLTQAQTEQKQSNTPVEGSQVIEEDPTVAHALGFSDVQWLADKLGVSVESETATVEPLGVAVRTPFVVFNGWKITVQEQREGRKTKYLLFAVNGEIEGRGVANARPHAVNWIKKHCK